jgi:hypothetical protein
LYQYIINARNTYILFIIFFFLLFSFPSFIVKDLDQKYQVTTTVATRATDINDKYSVLTNAKYIVDTAQVKVNNFLESSSTGKMIYEYIFLTQKQVSNVQSMARRIADEKKDKNYNPTPSHSHPDAQATSELISE